MGDDVHYRLRPGTDVVALSDGGYLFQSATASQRLDGDAARFFVETLLPRLDGRRPLSAVLQALPDLDAEDVRAHLDGLVAAGILTAATSEPAADGAAGAALLRAVEALGAPSKEVAATLAHARVVIFGLEGHGAHLALQLARCGVGELVLCDRFEGREADGALMPAACRSVAGRPREDVVLEVIGASWPGVRATALPGSDLSYEEVLAGARGSQLLAGCFDRGFVKCQHWVNRAAVTSGVPAIFSDLSGHLARVGPLVVPGETACGMCATMRRVACADSFVEAMEYEESLDGRMTPELRSRGVLPTLPAHVGSMLALEALKLLLRLDAPATSGAVLEVDGLRMATERHRILPRPDCPVCGKKKSTVLFARSPS